MYLYFSSRSRVLRGSSVFAVRRQCLVVIVVAGVFGMCRPIPDNLIVPVATVSRVDAGMPLTDLRRLVAALSELTWHKWTLGWTGRQHK